MTTICGTEVHILRGEYGRTRPHRRTYELVANQRDGVVKVAITP